ncbi:hypothetical protein CH06BL_43100 [Chromobacterium haemolyticum]|nr:hypothetical protein CH06BL_43100 [Chromobacterium haemolyticum]
MPITTSLVSPFASFIVAYANTQNQDPNNLVANIKSAIQPINGQWIADVNLHPPATVGVGNTFAFHLTEDREAAWGGQNQVLDRLNHLLACFISGRFAAIYISDADLKSGIHDALATGAITGWSPVDESILVHAYIFGNPLRTLWLGGTHRNVTVKPNSKILSGENLTDAIDPFGDSTFVPGAVRSSTAGVSLKRSGVWFGPKKNWHAFSTSASNLIQQLAIAQANVSIASSVVHQGLARNVHDFSSVGPAYHVEWAEPDTLKGVRRARKLALLREEYQIALGTQPVPHNKDASINITHTPSNTTTTLTISPKIVSKHVAFDITGPITQNFQAWENAIKSDAELIRIFYDSGHTITNATLSLSTVQDRNFSFSFHDFSPQGFSYNVAMEKPPGNPPPLNHMFTIADVSLFKWVFKEGLTQLAIPLPSPGQCWLYCDDRSGEVADFIHVHKLPGTVPKITLIHVKGANSCSANRQVSPGAYELVTAQAMKNLRRIFSSEILDAIKKCVTTNGNGRVWDQPWAIGLQSGPATPNDLLAALDAITTNCTYEVIIVQPHVLQSKYIVNGTQSTSTGAIQLRSLLFGAQAMARAASADFRVITDQR